MNGVRYVDGRGDAGLECVHNGFDATRSAFDAVIIVFGVFF